jgi:hypothetical protein
MKVADYSAPAVKRKKRHHAYRHYSDVRIYPLACEACASREARFAPTDLINPTTMITMIPITIIIMGGERADAVQDEAARLTATALAIY